MSSGKIIIKSFSNGLVIVFAFLFEKLEVKLFVLGNAVKIFLSVKGNNKRFEYFSWPRAHNPNSPHILEHISFDFSSENLAVCQDLWPSLMIIVVFNSSQLDNISMSTFLVEGKGIYDQQFFNFKS